MASGKPRRHKTNPGGRPSNAQRIEELNGQIARLRQLVSHKHHTDTTWWLIDYLLTTINELEDLSTPLRSTPWDGTGHGAERPILPGVHLTTAGQIVHAGTHAERLNNWLYLTVKWAISSARNRLENKEMDPKPKPPRRETSPSMQAPETPVTIAQHHER